MSKLIGISGKKRSGKDTVANILCLLHAGSTKYYFASPLKQEVARACGVTLEYLEEHKDNFRLILQGWGTNYRRQLCGEDYWVKKMEIAVSHLSERYNYIIVPDVRFKNEHDFIKNNGGVMFRVARDTGLVDTHISETDLDNEDFDEFLLNDSTLQYLIDQVKTIKL